MSSRLPSDITEDTRLHHMESKPRNLPLCSFQGWQWAGDVAKLMTYRLGYDGV